MDDQEMRRRAEALRALGQQREAALDAKRVAADATEAEFREGVRDFADLAARRLSAAGVPTIQAQQAPPPVEPQERRSWQRPTWRDRLTEAWRGPEAWRDPEAAQQPPAPETVWGWRIPILHPVTGQRTDHGYMFEIARYERGDVSGRATWFLVVFLTVDGRLCFAAQSIDAKGSPLLYSFDRDVHWVHTYAGKEVGSFQRAEVALALGFLRDSEKEWQVGREQAQVPLYETAEHNDRVGDGLLVGWHAALDELIQPR